MSSRLRVEKAGWPQQGPQLGGRGKVPEAPPTGDTDCSLCRKQVTVSNQGNGLQRAPNAALRQQRTGSLQRQRGALDSTCSESRSRYHVSQQPEMPSQAGRLNPRAPHQLCTSLCVHTHTHVDTLSPREVLSLPLGSQKGHMQAGATEAQTRRISDDLTGLEPNHDRNSVALARVCESEPPRGEGEGLVAGGMGRQA